MKNKLAVIGLSLLLSGCTGTWYLETYPAYPAYTMPTTVYSYPYYSYPTVLVYPRAVYRPTYGEHRHGR